MSATRASSAFRGLAVAALAILLTACSMLGLVYNRLDSLVGLYIEGLVDLTDEQSDQLDRTLADNLEWHRGSELQRYVSFLRDFAGSVDAGLDRERLLAANRAAEDWWRDICEQAAPGYTALALTLSDAQVEQLIAGLQREDDEEFAEYADASPAKRAERREKEVRRFFERFTGTLTPAQRALIKDYVATKPSTMEAWREQRRVWRDALAATLRERADTPEFHARMLQLIARSDELWTPEYRRAIDASRDNFIALVVELDRTLTASQRTATRRELLALATEVEKLRRA